MANYLGVEFGSTRIKAVKINSEFVPVASGDYTWSSKYENGVWTYDLDEVWCGLKEALSKVENVADVDAVGISGMMHGYLAFDEEWNLLVPFRTWQNTITAEAAEELTELFGFNIPQRWSIAHLYQAVLNGEEHICKVAHITTLAGYVHYMLTGVNAVGIGEASGIFPIDSQHLAYDAEMVETFDRLISKYNVGWTLEDVLPKVLDAGENAGKLTEKGAKLIDNMLAVGTFFAPAEGDAGTGMVATNAVAPRTGNISAGTSVFSMVVLEKPLQGVYPEIDMVTTPSGKAVAMVHCNNCTNDSNAWFGVLGEVVDLFGAQPTSAELYTKLYQKSLEGDDDCGGVMVCNYMAGEGVTHLDSGRPMIMRRPDSKFTLANFCRSTLYSTMATLKIGMDILAKEDVKIDSLTGHGGLFKTEGVCQKYMAAACDAPVTCMETAGEGGPYGMALLAAFVAFKARVSSGLSELCEACKAMALEEFLQEKVFNSAKSSTMLPDENTKAGFEKYMDDYRRLLLVEKKAVEVI